MPLDADTTADLFSLDEAARDGARLRPAKVVLSAEGDVGSALRAARESLGLAVEDIAQATRVQAVHIAAIEAFDLKALPSRPFTVGFVRAYARALGLETEAVVERFRAEAPGHDQDLRAPVALHLQTRRRFGWVAAAVCLVIVAVVAWNVSRHAPPPRRAAPRLAQRASAAPAPPVMAPAHLGAPLPAPPEAAPPPPYETPGLAPTDAAAPAPAAASADPPGRPFTPAGTIFGAPAHAGGVILQAVKPTTLVVRGGGAVYFARQLAAGEAWRAPTVAGLTVDVGNPASVEVYVAGLSRGPLTQAQTAVADLTPAHP